MLEELRCRGLSTISNEWIYGWYIQTDVADNNLSKHYILPSNFDGYSFNMSDLEVQSNTICKSINKKDKYDKCIYEYDILFIPQYDATFVLKYDTKLSAWIIVKLDDNGETCLYEYVDDIRWNETYIITNKITNSSFPNVR